MSVEGDPPVEGFVLAGGLARRMGAPAGGKASVPLAGRMLIEYPLAALKGAGLRARVVAKRSSPLPDLTGLGTEAVLEPEEPLHPVAGIVAALRASAGADAVVIACDTPLVDSGLVAELAGSAKTTMARSVVDGSGPQPLIARYSASDLKAIVTALEAEQAAQSLADRLEARLIDLPVLADTPDGRPVDAGFNVNTPADLELAESILGGPDGTPAEPRGGSR